MPETPDFVLRARTPADLDVLFELSADLDTWEQRTERIPRALTREQFDARLAGIAESEERGAAVSFVIDVGGAAVGTANLFEIDPLARNAEAGLNLLPSFRGLGLGTAVIRELAEFGFVRCNLHRIHLQAIASNAAAIRAYEKAGFVIEGRQREQAWVRGQYEDIVRMGLLRSEASA